MKSVNELDEIAKTFKKMSNDKGMAGLNLLEEVKFLNKTLIRLREEIDKNEVVNEMSQGKYSITRSNPALKTYNSAVKNYLSLMKQIVDLLPSSENDKTGEDLLKFIASGKK